MQINQLDNTNISAIIVSHNRRKLLERCVEKLLNQTCKINRILIVDNGSADDVINYLKQLKSTNNQIELLLQDNLGGAGGFHNGMEHVINNYPEIEYLWLMDDDGYPLDNALEKLVEASKLFDTTILNTFVVNDEISLKPSWPFHRDMNESLEKKNLLYFVNKANFFNGTLIPRTIIQRLGFPIMKLFVKGDELEYFERALMKLYIPMVTVRNSVFVHPSNDESNTTDISVDKIWHLYFNLRNMYHSHRFNVSKDIVSARNIFKLIKLFAYFKYWYSYKKAFLKHQITNKPFKKKVMNLALWHVITNNYNLKPKDVIYKLKTTIK